MTGERFPHPRPTIGVFTLATLNLAIVCTLRGLPIMAEEGLALVFYFIVVAVAFLLPVSLVSAELATGWPPNGPGGVYVWVKEAFGPRWGFLAIWMQWIQNVVWFPTALSFIGATLAYIYDPRLAENKIYMIAVIFAVFWGGTLINFRGMRASGRLSSICVLGGTILPGITIVALGVIWILSGEPLAIELSARDLIPDMSNIRNIVFLGGAFLIFSGMEVSASHSQEVRDPKRTFPRAILLAAVVSLGLLTLGALAIAVVVPQKELSLVSGVMETFGTFFHAHDLGWLIPVLGLLIAGGAIGEISAWIIGPAKGLMITAEEGYLPPLLQKVSERDVPTNILILQGVIVTIISLVFLLMPTVSSSYWILSAFSIVLYLLMYLFLFAAAIRLRYTQPDVERAYRIPGGNVGMWLVAGLGFLGVLFTFVVTFFPPAQIETGSPLFYVGFLIGGTVLMCLVALGIVHVRKPAWRPDR